MRSQTIVTLLLLHFILILYNNCYAQQGIYFMGNQSDSETIQDFIVENDSSAVAMINMTAQNNEQSVAIVQFDTALNILKSRRYFQPGFSILGNGFSNKSNNKIVATYLTFDAINFKLYSTINLLDANFDTLVALRTYHSTEDYAGLEPLFLDNDTLFGLVVTRDSVNNPNRIDLCKIDLVNKTIFYYKTIRIPQGKILFVTETSYDPINKVLGMALLISTDSSGNYYNPLFITLSTELQILNSLHSPDTISFTNGNVNIKSLGNNNFLLGYYKTSNIPGIGNYFMGEFNNLSGFRFMKIIPAFISNIRVAKKLDNYPNTTELASGITSLRIDSAGNLLHSVNHLTNPVYTFSNFSITGIHDWNNKILLTGGFNFGTPKFDATFAWIDSNQISCDHTPVNIVSIDSTTSFSSLILQISDTVCPLIIVNEAYQTDSLWLQLRNYCNNFNSLENNYQSPFKIYPNPSTGIINIDFNTYPFESSKELVYKVHDVSGRLIKSESITEDTSEINIESLTSGIYILSLLNGTNHHNIKFIKL
jgi:hypothetical protein